MRIELSERGREEGREERQRGPRAFCPCLGSRREILSPRGEPQQHPDYIPLGYSEHEGARTLDTLSRYSRSRCSFSGGFRPSVRAKSNFAAKRLLAGRDIADTALGVVVVVHRESH